MTQPLGPHRHRWGHPRRNTSLTRKRTVRAATLVLAFGLTLGLAGTANAASTPTQCVQARTGIANLRTLASTTKDPRLAQAYTTMANTNETIVNRMCP